MARKRNGETKEVTATSPDAIFEAKMEEARTDFGGTLYLNGTEEARVLCLPCPFAVKLLFQMPGIPLGRFAVIVGPPESGKSSLGYEFCRIFREVHGGGYTLIETENKDSTLLLNSIAGYGKKRRAVAPCEYVEEWMTALNTSIETTTDFINTGFKPPRSRPWVHLVDSLSGSTTKKIGEDIDQEGAAKQVHPLSANLISTYMKRMVHWLKDYPASIFAVNHLKLGQDSYGNMSVRKMQGGLAPRFHESIEIEMTGIGKQGERREPEAERFRTYAVRIAKNSLAQHSPTLEVDLVWRYVRANPEDPKSDRLQLSMWDWYSTVIEFLIDPPCSAQDKKRIRDVIDLKPSKKEKKVSSVALDIPEDNPVSYRKAGMILESRLDIQELLYDPLGIRPAFVFTPGQDIRVIREEAKRKIMASYDDIASYDVLQAWGGA